MILKHLKTRTETLHKDTEKDNLAKYILDHSITLNQYQSLLLKNYTAYATLSKLNQKYSDLLPVALKPFADSEKTDALKKDLVSLSIPVPAIDEPNVKMNISSASILGMLYVAEGSMMGGLLIRKNLEDCPHLRDIEKHHFFGKKAPEVLNRWKSFTETVNLNTYTDAEVDEAVEGANYAFSIF